MRACQLERMEDLTNLKAKTSKTQLGERDWGGKKGGSMKKFSIKKFLFMLKYKLRNQPGIGTVEIILILVVLIALVLIFKDQILSLAESIFGQVNKSVKGVY